MHYNEKSYSYYEVIKVTHKSWGGECEECGHYYTKNWQDTENVTNHGVNLNFKLKSKAEAAMAKLPPLPDVNSHYEVRRVVNITINLPKVRSLINKLNS